MKLRLIIIILAVFVVIGIIGVGAYFILPQIGAGSAEPPPDTTAETGEPITNTVDTGTEPDTNGDATEVVDTTEAVEDVATPTWTPTNEVASVPTWTPTKEQVSINTPFPTETQTPSMIRTVVITSTAVITSTGDLGESALPEVELTSTSTPTSPPSSKTSTDDIDIYVEMPETGITLAVQDSPYVSFLASAIFFMLMYVAFKQFENHKKQK